MGQLVSTGLLKYLGGEERAAPAVKGETREGTLVRRKGFEDTELSLLLELQSDILLTISCLCETDIHRKVRGIH